MKKRRQAVKLVIFAVLILFFVAASQIPGVKEQVTLANLLKLRAMFNEPVSGPLLFLVAALVVILCQLPGMIMIVGAGLVYDFGEAVLLSMISAVVGQVVIFLVARYLLKDSIYPKLQKSVISPYLDRFEKNSIASITVLRIIFVMFPPLTWLLGATDIRTRDFIFGSVLGLLPMIVAIQLTLGHLKSVESISELMTFRTFAVVGVFALFYAGIYVARRMVAAKRQRIQETETV